MISGRGRTFDFLLRKQTLYPLSYRRNYNIPFLCIQQRFYSTNPLRSSIQSSLPLFPFFQAQFLQFGKEIAMIRAVMVISTQGKPRLLKFYQFQVRPCPFLSPFHSINHALQFITNCFPNSSHQRNNRRLSVTSTEVSYYFIFFINSKLIIEPMTWCKWWNHLLYLNCYFLWYQLLSSIWETWQCQQFCWCGFHLWPGNYSSLQPLFSKCGTKLANFSINWYQNSKIKWIASHKLYQKRSHYILPMRNLCDFTTVTVCIPGGTILRLNHSENNS